MANVHELIVSASDAEVLALMLGERRPQPALDAAAADALADLLFEARLVPPQQLPADRVALGSKVTYEEGTGRQRRSVILVHPIEAEAAAGRISVLSPVGLGLLGRPAGAVVHVAIPAGNVLTLRILETTRNRDALAA
jgi:regulator of nucleoside diphosphate kinase